MQAEDWEGFINTVKSVVVNEHKINKKKIDRLRLQYQQDMAMQMDYRISRMKMEFKYELKELRAVIMDKTK